MKFATKLRGLSDLFIKHSCIKFQDEIQFSSNTIMEQLKHHTSESFILAI